MEAGSCEMESYFRAEDDSSSCIGIDECSSPLFDDDSAVGPVDPFIDMKWEVVVV